MYSPSGVFQLQALQSPATGKDYTRFNLNVRTVGSSQPGSSLLHGINRYNDRDSPAAGKA